MKKLTVPLALGIVLGVTMAASAITSFETARDWAALSDAFRNGYAAGAADLLNVVADDIATEPLEKTRDWARSASECLSGARYKQLSALRNSLDTAVADRVATGKGNIIVASTLYVIAIACK